MTSPEEEIQPKRFNIQFHEYPRQSNPLQEEEATTNVVKEDNFAKKNSTFKSTKTQDKGRKRGLLLEFPAIRSQERKIASRQTKRK